MTIKESRERLNMQRYSEEWEPWKSDLPRISAIIKLVGENKRVLDIGTYDATIGKLIANNNNDVYGIDISERAVELAIEKGIKAFKLDIEDEELPFSNSFFDCIVAAEVIEHIFDTDAFLEKIRRVLKPGGYLIITTPNIATLGRRLLLLFGKNPLIEVSCNGNSGGHIRYFVYDSLTNLLRQHEFNIETFTSDVVNFNTSGNLFSTKIAKVLPSIGKSLIIRAISRQ